MRSRVDDSAIGFVPYCSPRHRARYRSSTDHNHGGLGRLRSRAPLAPHPNRIPAEEMAAKIETMVKPVFLNSFQ